MFIFNRIVFFSMALLLLNSCSKNDDNISSDLTGNWRVIYFLENGNRITKSDENTWPNINNGDITANFTEPDGDGKGTVSGITVSNMYSAEYTIQEAGKISIGPIQTTLGNEPEWTQLFRLYLVENFENKSSRLLLYYNNRESTIVFERK